MNPLDDPSTYRLDASGMFGHIARLGLEFERAWLASATMRLPGSEYDNMVVAALGGSASPADYFAAHSAKESSMPVEVVRGYALPAYSGPRTLVVALSYSGTTEEVISCYRDARRRGCALLVITRGGPLGAMAEADGVPVHPILYESRPRASLGHTLAALMRVGWRLGMNSLCDPDVHAVASAHRRLVAEHLGVDVPAERNPAKQLAELLVDARPLVIVGAQHLAAPARRSRNQFAENAKAAAIYEELPEVTHNLVVGLRAEGEIGPAVLAFDSPSLREENRRRAEVLAGLVEQAGGAFASLPCSGVSRLADQLEASAWGDYLSCYLALLRGIDPTPTPALDAVRTALNRTPA